MVSSVGSNASLLVATSTNALKNAVDSSEEAVAAILETPSSGDTSTSSNGGLDIYA